MPLPAIAGGGRNGNIRRPAGQLTRVMTNRFADRAIDGGETQKCGDMEKELRPE